jgi:hypothetical protein
VSANGYSTCNSVQVPVTVLAANVKFEDAATQVYVTSPTDSSIAFGVALSVQPESDVLVKCVSENKDLVQLRRTQSGAPDHQQQLQFARAEFSTFQKFFVTASQAQGSVKINCYTIETTTQTFSGFETALVHSITACLNKADAGIVLSAGTIAVKMGEVSPATVKLRVAPNDGWGGRRVVCVVGRKHCQTFGGEIV